MPSLINLVATGLALATAIMAQELTTQTVPTSVPTTTTTGCQTMTVEGEVCGTCIRPACLVMSTLTPRCDCPTPGVVPTVTKNYPCTSGGCAGLGCSTTYVMPLIGIRCSSMPPHGNTTTTTLTETRTSCPGGCPGNPPKPTTHTTTTVTCKGNCPPGPTGTGVPPPPPPPQSSTTKPPVTAGAAILRPFWVM